MMYAVAMNVSDARGMLAQATEGLGVHNLVNGSQSHRNNGSQSHRYNGSQSHRFRIDFTQCGLMATL